MPDTDGSLMRHAAVAACLCLTLAATASAQYTEPPGFAPAPASPDFLTRYDFHLSAAKLSPSTPDNVSDPRFVWDTHFGGDLDVVDYVSGRISMLVDYEAVLGDQFRPFDPNQGNYTLEASGSLRVGETEIAGVLHHVSRHLGDRAKRFPIAWNVLGVRAMRRVPVAGATIDVTVGGGKVVQHSTVDYKWTGDLDLLIRRPINERVGLFARGTGEIFLIDSTLSNRDHQTGGKAEAGVRLNGRSGALELFAGYERRIDADPLEFLAHDWALAGFRLLGK
ncbi:MAG TPA: hypothetical protein VG222_02595 [Vicinamibacterales bacterium]|jgi:hypothetical protein|nr:hypothetical protein [Vicinamibacterales bacterium]